MLARWKTRVASLTASSLASLAVVVLVLSRREQPVLAMHWVEPAPVAAGAAPARPSGFRVRRLSETERERFMPSHSLHLLDEQCYFRLKPCSTFAMPWPEHPDGRFVRRTNSLGLRNASEVRADRPELRILVTGDSHSDGVCNAEETYTARLERLLAARGRDVEALNAAVGGYGFHQYVGALERYLALAPDVVVVGIFGGNDFFDLIAFQHLFAGTSVPYGGAVYRDQVIRAQEECGPVLAQGLLSLRYFAEFPDQVEVALEGARIASAEIADLCASHGARLVFVYIPPAYEVALRFHEDAYRRATELLGLREADFERGEDMARRYLASLRYAGCEVVDVRPRFREQGASPYWSRDFHVSLAGHRLIAEELAPRISALVPPGYARHSRVADLGALESAEPRPVAAAAPLPPEFEEARVRERFAFAPEVRFDPDAVFVLDVAKVPDVDGDGLWRSPPLPGVTRRCLLAADELVFAPGDLGRRLGELVSELASVECLDATTPGAGPLHYSGLVTKHASRGASTLVVVWNGGNDFLEALELRRESGGAAEGGGGGEDRGGSKPAATRRRRKPIASLDARAVAKRFASRAKDARQAIEASLEHAREIRRRCHRAGRRLLVVAARPHAGATADGRDDVLERMAGLFAGALREEGIRCLDIAAGPDGEPALDPATGRLTGAARGRVAAVIANELAAER